MAAVIKVENLSKAYQLGQFGTKTISGDVQRWWMTRILGKEDPFLKIGEANDRSVKGKSNMVWSLKDINFEVQQGEALGIIGKNGAGKSTLLKILSRVTAPTTGRVRMKGMVASLLEVGTGFHPELSGRENIFLNGTILGMRKIEIQKRLDEIVDFAGIERYLDTPVKRYSSGMYVRLAFAVAAHLDAEILVVDEVLAVGDAQFQKKCIGKMGEISKGEGRTILFVSHNMVSVRNLCKKGVFLENGIIKNQGDITSIVDDYATSYKGQLKNYFKDRVIETSRAYIKAFKIDSEIVTGGKFSFEAEVHSQIDIRLELAFTLRTFDNQPLFQMYSGHSGVYFELKKGKNIILANIDSLPLIQGDYLGNVWLGSNGVEHDFVPGEIKVTVREGSIRKNGPISSNNGYPIIQDANWSNFN
jgi:lipopolysaccharide transport system ATP-binding protein